MRSEGIKDVVSLFSDSGIAQYHRRHQRRTRSNQIDVLTCPHPGPYSLDRMRIENESKAGQHINVILTIAKSRPMRK